jgi:DNA polymerase-4
MHWPHAFIHLDMDTFFVSVERIHNPSLNGKPVIVGGGKGGDTRRGVVAACSYETRKFGVHSAMPLAQAIRLCPKAIVVPVGTSNYGEYTRKVRGILESFTDLVEMTSPDEAYIDLQGTERLHGGPIDAAHKLRQAVSGGTGLPVSVGLAASKTFSKIASKLSKPQGLFVVFPGQEASIARPLAVRALPGLGPKTADHLKRHGIRTLGELIDAGEARLRAVAGDHATDLWRRAQGEVPGSVDPARERIQISTESTFGEDIEDEQRLMEILARMTMKLGSALRKREQWAGTLTIKIRYPDFTTLTRQLPIDPPAQDDRILNELAKQLFRKHWDRRPLRLLGVAVSGLTTVVQEDLFSGTEADRRRRVLEAMDAVGKKSGADTLRWGSTLGPAKKKPPR